MAKIIIDIDDDKYENIKNHYYFMYETGVMFAIKNGIVLPSNPTNGDMINMILGETGYVSVDKNGRVHLRGVNGEWLKKNYMR